MASRALHRGKSGSVALASVKARLATRDESALQMPTGAGSSTIQMRVGIKIPQVPRTKLFHILEVWRIRGQNMPKFYTRACATCVHMCLCTRKITPTLNRKKCLLHNWNFFNRKWSQEKYSAHKMASQLPYSITSFLKNQSII